MNSLLVVFSAILLTVSSVSLDYNHDYNLTSAATDFSYRKVGTSYKYIAGTATELLLMKSVAYDDSDVVLAIGSDPRTGNVPYAVLVYGTGSDAVNTDVSSFAGDLVKLLNPKFDSKFEGNALIMAPLGFQEYDSNGNAVGKFGSFQVVTGYDTIEGDDENLVGLSFSHKVSGAQVTFTHVASKKAGVLEYGYSKISPRSFDMLIQVDGFSLTDPENHIRLVATVATAGSDTIEGNSLVLRRQGREDLYVALSNRSIVDGDICDVSVTFGSGSDDTGEVTNRIFKAAIGGDYDDKHKLAYIDFPKGATSFIYNLALGVGANVKEAEIKKRTNFGKRIIYREGKNLTNAAVDFPYRYCSSSYTLSSVATELFLWRSVSIDESVASDSEKESADVMLGFGSLPSNANVPFSVFAYGIGPDALSAKISKIASNLFALSPKFVDTFAGNTVGMAALGMQEYDPQGNAVGKYISFKHTSLYDKVSGEDDNLKGLSFSYSPADTSAKLTFTYMTSLNGGIIEYGDTPVSPRSFETIIEVSGFSLSDPANHVRMDLGILTTPGTGRAESNSVVLHRQGQEDMYLALSDFSIVGGARARVTISMESGEPETGSISKKILKTALGGEFETQIAHIDFPAGISDFIYDPAIGSGVNIYAAAEPANVESDSETSSNIHGSSHTGSSHHESNPDASSHGSHGSHEGSGDLKKSGSDKNNDEGLGVLDISLIVAGALVLSTGIIILGVCLAKKKSKKDKDQDISRTYIDSDNPDFARACGDIGTSPNEVEMEAPVTDSTV